MEGFSEEATLKLRPVNGVILDKHHHGAPSPKSLQLIVICIEHIL